MKKYQQLILVILSLLSLISLLFYRHEYNKLRYVLEVLNFFGTPGISTSATATCTQNITAEKHLMSEPLPAWQRVSNTLYIYSAYWETLDDKGHVKAIAIGVLNENLNYGCYLWYDRDTNPVKGQFSFSGIARKNQEGPSRNSIGSKYFGKTSKTKAFMFYCDGNSGLLMPFGVTFYKGNNDDNYQAFAPVTSVNVTPPPQNGTAVCILPTEYPYLLKSQYLEFLSFHKAVGVNDFIIYGGNFQHNIISPILKDFSYDINLIVLQWNYPFLGDFDIMRVVAESDCLLRTKGLFENVVILRWNQFVVPRNHTNINSMLIELDPDRKVSKFLLPALLFCIEYKDDSQSDLSLPLVFRKSRYSLPKTDIPIIIHRPHVKSGIQKISNENAAIHWYTKCDMFDLKLPDKTTTTKKHDYSMLRFKTELMQSRLLKINY